MENIEKQLVENGFEKIDGMRYYYKHIQTSFRNQEATMTVTVEYINFGWRVSMEQTSAGYFPRTYGTKYISNIEQVEQFCKSRKESISILKP